MAHDVFISYSSRDKPAADAVCATLEQEGIRCWVAPRDIAPGADWSASIMEAIGASRVLLLIFSGQANGSRHVQREVQHAADSGLAIIPFRLEDVLPTGGMKYYLGTVHWLDALTPPMERHHAALVKAIEALLLLPGSSTRAVPATPAIPAMPVDPPPPPMGPRRRRWPWLPVLAVVLAAGAGISLYAGRDRFFPTPAVPPVSVLTPTPPPVRVPTAERAPTPMPTPTPAVSSAAAPTATPVDPQVQAARSIFAAGNARIRATQCINLMKIGDYDRLVNYTYPTVIAAIGGREEFVAQTKAAMDQMSAKGVKITAVEIGKPGEPVSVGDKSFIVVPMKMTLDTPTTTVVSRSYLLGILTAGGEWLFVDGSALTPEGIRRLVPDLPAALQLPEKQPPTVTPKAS